MPSIFCVWKSKGELRPAMAMLPLWSPLLLIGNQIQPTRVWAGDSYSITLSPINKPSCGSLSIATSLLTSCKLPHCLRGPSHATRCGVISCYKTFFSQKGKICKTFYKSSPSDKKRLVKATHHHTCWCVVGPLSPLWRLCLFSVLFFSVLHYYDVFVFSYVQ